MSAAPEAGYTSGLPGTKESVYDPVSTNPLNPPCQGDFLGTPSLIREGRGGFLSAKIALQKQGIIFWNQSTRYFEMTPEQAEAFIKEGV